MVAPILFKLDGTLGLAAAQLRSAGHPDFVAHLGPDLRQLAEFKAKEFNSAMDYSSKHLTKAK